MVYAMCCLLGSVYACVRRSLGMVYQVVENLCSL